MAARRGEVEEEERKKKKRRGKGQRSKRLFMSSKATQTALQNFSDDVSGQDRLLWTQKFTEKREREITERSYN